MRIGELAERVGVTPDTLRFYERAGWLPRPARSDNGYRRYREADIEHLRLLIDLRRLDLPLDEAARLASWCHSGHCGEMSTTLVERLASKRAEIAERVARLLELDARLADLEGHVARSPARPAARIGRGLAILDVGPACCEAASAVSAVAEGACASCGSVPAAGPFD